MSVDKVVHICHHISINIGVDQVPAQDNASQIGIHRMCEGTIVRGKSHE